MITPLRSLKRTHTPSEKAFALMEAIVAVGVSMTTLGAVLLLNAQQLRLVKSARESNAASLALQDRIERMRTLTWKNFTDAAYLKDNFLASTPSAARQLARYTERISVSAWPNADASGKVLVEASNGTNGLVLLSGQGLSDQRQGKVDMTISWLGKDNRPRERMYTTVISNSGVNKTSLPGFGGPTGGAWTGTTTSSSPTPLPGAIATPPPIGVPTPPSIATPTPAPSTSKGRGNAGGKSGKG